MAKKIIHIFLGSSIVEFEMERLQLTEFIRDLSDKVEDDFDIKIQPINFENVDTNVPRSGGKQDEYNELIKSSEMCFFIFFTRAGEFTCEEFDVAYKALTECGKPKIYVYFKNIPAGQTADPSLAKFMSKIDNEIKHYHGTFDDIDTIKLRILLNIKLQEMDFLEVKYKDGKCFAGGREVNKLDINKVSEFKNNSGLKDLREELAETEKVYFALKAHYDEKQGDENYYKEYSEVASKRANLLKLIEETEKEIFSLSLNMCKNAVHGEVTARQAMAYELFEKGDLRGANNILDFDEIKSEYLRRKAMLEAELKKNDIRYIRELKTKIEVLTAMTDYAERFAKIEEIYEEIIPVAEESLVETDVLFDYASYLYTQNNFNKSAEIYTRIEKLFENNSELATNENLARLYNNAGSLYRVLNN
ncbi:MAG: hypothetical protein LUD27_07045, partial [Clostridia bacterium]|nr:hypothetical protein [Clostridia bacterium]